MRSNVRCLLGGQHAQRAAEPAPAAVDEEEEEEGWISAKHPGSLSVAILRCRTLLLALHAHVTRVHVYMPGKTSHKTSWAETVKPHEQRERMERLSSGLSSLGRVPVPVYIFTLSPQLV